LRTEVESARKRPDAAALENVIPLGVADPHAGPLPVHH
jgi:hypothetical protein